MSPAESYLRLATHYAATGHLAEAWRWLRCAERVAPGHPAVTATRNALVQQ